MFPKDTGMKLFSTANAISFSEKSPSGPISIIIFWFGFKTDFNDCIVTESYSFTSAWKFISEHVFDVILLDMSLPTFDKTDSDPGGVFRIFGGKKG